MVPDVHATSGATDVTRRSVLGRQTPDERTIMSDYLRRADLATLAKTLNDQRVRTLDAVVRANAIVAEHGRLIVPDVEPIVTPDGPAMAPGTFRLQKVALQQLASTLDIPLRYLDRTFTQRPDIFDDNVNGWLEASDRKHLLRMLRDGEGATTGVVRAVLSDRYRVIDNFDVLLSVLNGLQEAGVDSPDVETNLTEQAMIVRVRSTGVAALAPKLLEGYRSPFTGQTGTDNPTVFAGFVIRNSEVGRGRFTITPEITVQVCTNGMTMTKDAVARTHLGAELGEGTQIWSDETLRKNLALVKSQTTDAVRAFMSEEYVTGKVSELEVFSDVKLDDPATTIVQVGERFAFTKDEQDAILNNFIKGGQTTAGGVMQAITATAQTIDSADRQYELNGVAVEAMAFAAGRKS